MMSRITLNLKKFAHKRLESSLIGDPGPLVFHTGPAWPTAAGTDLNRSPTAETERYQSRRGTAEVYCAETEVYRPPPDW